MDEWLVDFKSVLDYEDLYQSKLEGFNAGSNLLVPRHVAILGDKGCWESVTGDSEPLIYHEVPEALSTQSMGTPRWVYIPMDKQQQ